MAEVAKGCVPSAQHQSRHQDGFVEQAETSHFFEDVLQFHAAPEKLVLVRKNFSEGTVESKGKITNGNEEKGNPIEEASLFFSDV